MPLRVRVAPAWGVLKKNMEHNKFDIVKCADGSGLLAEIIDDRGVIYGRVYTHTVFFYKKFHLKTEQLRQLQKMMK